MQAVDEIYRSRLFVEEKMIDWEEKTDVDKTWKKSHAGGGRYERELYVWRGEDDRMGGEMDVAKTWTFCKAYFKQIYTKQKSYNKTTGKDSKAR